MPAKKLLPLRIFISLMLFGMLAAAIYFSIIHKLLMAQYPLMTMPVFLLYMSVCPLLIASGIGLWKLKKWGFVLFCIAFVIAFATELYCGFPIAKTIRIPVMFIVLCLLLYPHRRQMS